MFTFGIKTVDGVLETFNKAIEDLNEINVVQTTKAKECQEQLDYHNHTIARCQRVLKKLNSIIE